MAALFLLLSVCCIYILYTNQIHEVLKPVLFWLKLQMLMSKSFTRLIFILGEPSPLAKQPNGCYSWPPPPSPMTHYRLQAARTQIGGGSLGILIPSLARQGCFSRLTCYVGPLLCVVTFVSLFSTVCFQMLPQIAFLRRCILRSVAFVWFFSTVDPNTP